MGFEIPHGKIAYVYNKRTLLIKTTVNTITYLNMQDWIFLRI